MIAERKIQINSQFRYLDTIILNYAEIDSDANHKIKVNWLNKRRATTVLYDLNILLRLKNFFLGLLLALLSGTQCTGL